MWKIVIIDDDRQVLQGMKQAIPWDELNAEWAGEAMNGADGLEVIHNVQPDIVMTDIYMPVMNGLDMIERLREEKFGGKIIILSGYSDFEYARQALRLEVADYLSKPVSLSTLKEVLGRSLGQLAQEEESRVRQDELERKLMTYEPFIEKEWVKTAVSGALDHTFRSDELLPEDCRYWRSCRHAVIGIEVVRDVRASQLSIPDWNLFRFAIGNIVTEIAAGQAEAYEYTELAGTRSALVLHPPKEQSERETAEKLEELGKQLIDSMRNYLKLTIRVGIGTVKSDWRDIPDSTEEAFRAIELKRQPAAGGYEVYTGILGTAPEEGASAAMRPVKFYSEVAGAIKTSQQSLANDIVDEYICRLEHEQDVTPDYLQRTASELWGIIAYSLYDVGMVLDDLFPDVQLPEELAVLTRPAHMGEWLKSKIAVICSSREWRGNSKHRQAVDFMIQYIHEHYVEDMTLADLADKVFISRNYLSIIFKNMTGETFNNYLTRVRIEKAKELLMERKMLVYEVAEQVGYKNVPYFSTLFKKFTGMNPTELAK
ncbi:response regulator transcription factor [Paenibacillus kobensis]|uniref:response regulator transcription factor n=1 Tax=Paenibacillus kobensis TaxID=59841 RepID=UPI000FDAD962|nr:response regulator transcription factor [Paenibacillus kobensis]